MMTACQSSQDTMLELYRQTRTKPPLVHTNSSTYVSANATIHLVKISIELAKEYHASYGTLHIYPAPSYRLRSYLITFSGLKKFFFIHTSSAQHSHRTGTSRSRTDNLRSTKTLTKEPTIHYADHDPSPVTEPLPNVISYMLLP